MTSPVLPKRTTADRLIDATLVSIHRYGLGATSVTNVTEIAGLSRGMVRHEFGSKKQLVVAAMTRVCDRWLAATEPNTALSGPEQVRSIMRAMFDPAAVTPVAVDSWLALSVGARSDPELARIHNAAQYRWMAQLKSAFEASGVTAPETAALGLIATADGLWLGVRLKEDLNSIDVALEAALLVANALLVTAP